MKKAVSAATSAALLASLLATAVAPSAFAAATTAGVGNVGRASTSTATATFTFSEETTACIYSAVAAHDGEADLFVQIAPKDPDGAGPLSPVGNVQFVGTPTLVAPGSLGGATATLVQKGAYLNDTIRIRIYAGDLLNKQQITVSGLKVKASSGATLGAIQTGLYSDDANTLAKCFLGTTATASGTVSNAIGIGAASVVVAVSSGAFVATGTVTGTTTAGKLVFATGESVNIASVSAVVAGLQTLTIAATTVVHPANEAVTQTGAPNAPAFPITTIFTGGAYLLTSVGTVTDSVKQDVWSTAGGIPAGGAGADTKLPLNINPGEQNQSTLSTYIYERSGTDATTGSAGFIAKDTILTFKIDAAGVLFSASPTVQAYDAFTGLPYTYAQGSIALKLDGAKAPAAPVPPAIVGIPNTNDGAAVCTISFDRTSCSIKVTQASTDSLHQAVISLHNILMDVASTVAKGTPVNIVVTGVPVAVDYNTVAYVSRVIVGVAAQPTIYINYNDQQSGMMTLTESGAGFFTDASVTYGNNVFGLCLTSGETFTRAPWAVVSTGDLKLLSGLVGATSVQGTLFNIGTESCAKWTVYSASTVASTVDIRGSDASNAVLAAGALNGPRYSVSPLLPSGSPGATLVDILVGNDTTVRAGTAVSSSVSNAVRAFKSGVVVTALSQPMIPQGSPDSLGGKLQITETLAGQFKPGETVCVAVLPRASNTVRTQDTLFKEATTNDLPVITTNTATGLLVQSVAQPGCSEGSRLFGLPTDLTNSFSFDIYQQAYGTLGQITISNIHFITTADAPVGPVLVTVGGWDSGVEFQTAVSNAKIGVAAKLSIGAVSALGLKPTSGYTTSTPKTAKLGKYITWKFTGGTALAGQRVNILVAKKINGAWGGPAYLKSAWADANGIVTFAWTSKTAVALNVRAQWPGSANYAVSTSKALGSYWK